MSNFFDNDITIIEPITLDIVYSGMYIDREIMRKSLCDVCKGVGSDDGILRVCKKCRGRRILVSPATDGQLVTRVCEYCQGVGLNMSNHCCQKCNGKRVIDEKITIKFLIPVGVKNNEKIILYRNGNVNIGNNIRDNIIIHINVLNTDTFKIIPNTNDLEMKLDVPLCDALHGIDMFINMPQGIDEKIVIKPIIKNDVYIIKNLGLPIGNNGVFGDLHVNVNILFPKSIPESISDELYNLLQNCTY